MTGVERFGRTEAGRAVTRVTIAAGALRVAFLDHGARLWSVRLAGGANLTLASDRFEAYEGALASAGAVVGPVANRIAGATAELDGARLRLAANQAGRHCLHSGPEGLHAQIWQIVETAPDAVTFRCDLADGAGGFPGNRRIEARYAVRAPAELSLTISAETDRPTLMNPASHPFWCLDGGAGQRLSVAADRYLPVDGDIIPTGEIAAVAGTPFDHRALRVPDPGLDHNFCLGAAAAPRPVARLEGVAGTVLELSTDAPGLQAYAGNPAGIALEPQLWPDAPHHPAFPSIVLRPGTRFAQRSLIRFSAPDIG